MDYDAALDLVGGCGRYQMLVFFLLGIICMKAALEIQLLVLVTYTPPFSCVQPYNSTNSTASVCHAEGMPNVTCTSWSYDKSLVDRTLVTEFNMVCEREYLQPLYMTLVLISILVGRLVGLSNDIFGRRKVYLILVGYDLLLTPIQAFVPTLQAQFVLRMLRGFGDGVLLTSYGYLIEFLGTKYRAKVAANYWLCFCIGYAGTAFLGYFIRDWRYVQVTICIVFPAYIAQWFLLYESPRWLLVKGRKKEAVDTLLKIAKINGKKNVTYEKLVTVRIEEDVTTGKLRDCFSSRAMAMKTIIMAITLWSGSFAYFGISLDGTIASQNIYITMALMGLIEIPCSPLAWIIGDKLGRKWPSSILFILSGIIIIIVPHLPAAGSAAWVKALVAVLGKLVLNTGFLIILVYVTELQPTCIRNVSLLPALILLQLGAILSPLVLHQAAVGYWIPSVIFGVWCFVGALVMIPLPETNNMPLTQTVEEANLLVMGKEHLFKARLDALRARKDKDALLEDEQIKDIPRNIRI